MAPAVLDATFMIISTLPSDITDPINARILAVSEDRIAGFCRDPIGEIARQSGLSPAVVVERITAMLRAGTIRRVRQTLLATNLAQGALVAWVVPAGETQQRLRLDVSERSIFRARRDPQHRFGGCRQQIPALDHAEGSAGIFDGESLPASLHAHRGRGIQTHAGQTAVRAGRRPRAPPRTGAGQQGRSAGGRHRKRHRPIERPGLARPDSAEARVRAGGNLGKSLGRPRAERRAFHWRNFAGLPRI